MFNGNNGKNCALIKSDRKRESNVLEYPKLASALKKMNNSNVKTTTEINTEIKVEVMLETAHILQVEDQINRACQSNNATNEIIIEKERSGHGNGDSKQNEDKSRDQIKAEREARKLAKQLAKINKTNIQDDSQQITIDTSSNSKDLKGKPSIAKEIVNEKKKPALTKAERRAIQDAQRAAKAQAQLQTNQPRKKINSDKNNKKELQQKEAEKVITKSNIINKSCKTMEKTQMEQSAGSACSTPTYSTCLMNDGNVKLFSHLKRPNTNINQFINHSQLHSSVIRLGEQYAKRIIVGSNARCIAFLNALKWVIQDYETPPQKEFTRSLERYMKNCVNYLNNCRTLAVSVINAHKYIKQMLTQLSNNQPESELKNKLVNLIDTYMENQIDKAAQAINCTIQQKIADGDVILTFGCSSLVNYILEAAHANRIDFRVIIVDSRPFCEGRELLRRLSDKGLSCTYVLINAISFIMPEVTKILLGAHALLANGYVMSRTGTSQVALVAQSFNVPVLVCCETHKFSERFQTDAIVYNELANPNDLIVDNKCSLANWQTKPKMSPLNLNYDITPPELVSAVVTEVAVLPCTSVPVILRMKPDWLMYIT